MENNLKYGFEELNEAQLYEVNGGEPVSFTSLVIAFGIGLAIGIVVVTGGYLFLQYTEWLKNATS